VDRHRQGCRALERDGTVPCGASHVLDDIQGLVMIRDRDSNIWVGTPNGLTRIDARGNSSFDRRDNSSTGPVTSLFEDREGNLWMGTTRGIERLRESAFTTYSIAAGLPRKSTGRCTWTRKAARGRRHRKAGCIGSEKAALDA